jgi:hypothetical protein
MTPALAQRLRSMLAAPQETLTCTGPGCTTISGAQERRRVRLVGHIRSITLSAAGQVPSMAARLDDGTGSVRLVWLGQRSIAGVGPGSALTVEGRISMLDGQRTILNPHYTLMAAKEGA